MMIPRVREATGERLPHELFPLTPELRAGGMVGLLSSDRVVPGLAGPYRVWDAAAAAVLHAAGSGRRRAVLVALARRWQDGSRYGAASIRRFAESLHVPLFVWCLATAEPPASECAGAPALADFKALRREMDHLTDALDGQRIVWLEGSHPPLTVRMTAAARAAPVAEAAVR